VGEGGFLPSTKYMYAKKTMSRNQSASHAIRDQAYSRIAALLSSAMKGDQSALSLTLKGWQETGTLENLSGLFNSDNKQEFIALCNLIDASKSAIRFSTEIDENDFSDNELKYVNGYGEMESEILPAAVILLSLQRIYLDSIQGLLYTIPGSAMPGALSSGALDCLSLTNDKECFAMFAPFGTDKNDGYLRNNFDGYTDGYLFMKDVDWKRKQWMCGQDAATNTRSPETTRDALYVMYKYEAKGFLGICDQDCSLTFGKSYISVMAKPKFDGKTWSEKMLIDRIAYKTGKAKEIIGPFSPLLLTDPNGWRPVSYSAFLHNVSPSYEGPRTAKKIISTLDAGLLHTLGGV